MHESLHIQRGSSSSICNKVCCKILLKDQSLHSCLQSFFMITTCTVCLQTSELSLVILAKLKAFQTAERRQGRVLCVFALESPAGVFLKSWPQQFCHWEQARLSSWVSTLFLFKGQVHLLVNCLWEKRKLVNKSSNPKMNTFLLNWIYYDLPEHLNFPICL